MGPITVVFKEVAHLGVASSDIIESVIEYPGEYGFHTTDAGVLVITYGSKTVALLGRGEWSRAYRGQLLRKGN